MSKYVLMEPKSASPKHRYSTRSLEVYETLHPDLQVLMSTVLEVHDHSLIQGHRTREEHEALLAKVPVVTTVTYSQTMHRFSPSLAVDAIPYIPGRDPWNKKQICYFVGIVVGTAAQLWEQGLMEYRIRVGIDWDRDNDVSLLDTSFWDGPHIELVGANHTGKDMSQ